MNRRGFLRFFGLVPVGLAAASMPAISGPLRHSGGVARLGKAYIVGESAGEAFIPGSFDIQPISVETAQAWQEATAPLQGDDLPTITDTALTLDELAALA